MVFALYEWSPRPVIQIFGHRIVNIGAIIILNYSKCLFLLVTNDSSIISLKITTNKPKKLCFLTHLHIFIWGSVRHLHICSSIVRHRATQSVVSLVLCRRGVASSLVPSAEHLRAGAELLRAKRGAAPRRHKTRLTTD